MKRKKTKNVVLYAMFIAIELVLITVPFLGYIPIGPLRATTLHIPVIIAGILLGVRGGAIVGLTFGVSSLIYNTINPTITSFVFSPFISGNILSACIAIIPRVLIGVVAGYLYQALAKKSTKDSITMGIASMAGALTNTILVLGGIYLIFGTSYATALGKDFQQLLPYFIGILTTQSILEAVVGAIISVAVSQTLIKIVRV